MVVHGPCVVSAVISLIASEDYSHHKQEVLTFETQDLMEEFALTQDKYKHLHVQNFNVFDLDRWLALSQEHHLHGTHIYKYIAPLTGDIRNFKVYYSQRAPGGNLCRSFVCPNGAIDLNKDKFKFHGMPTGNPVFIGAWKDSRPYKLPPTIINQLREFIPGIV